MQSRRFWLVGSSTTSKCNQKWSYEELLLLRGGKPYIKIILMLILVAIDGECDVQIMAPCL
jgi:hypothetical protein